MNEEVQLNLQLNINQINVVLTGLGKLPLESSLQTFETIHKQVNDQMQKENQPEGPLKDKVIK
jgi:hypothetical protein